MKLIFLALLALSSFAHGNTSESQRTIKLGETVIYDGEFWIVTNLPAPGLYDLLPDRDRDKDDIVRDVARGEIAITRGCHQAVCTKDSVIDLARLELVAVMGLEYSGKFITRTVDGSDEFIFGVDAATLAATHGCVRTSYGKLCTKNEVQDRFNRTFLLMGIQQDGNVVIQSVGGAGGFQPNVSPSSLLPKI